ncbi:hypothetical protein [Streptomyces sp. MH60]|uniref:hypothetical protein n=1 Tax=Streptomyces sp. MH60 TaxID=1940758 RepID=UPI000CEE0285|nr:hypothetical protein [Streptomyces sp. MH60]PPS89536.1 hypothetical protein BZZ08_01683 [Streptomyces sp. MH60]
MPDSSLDFESLQRLSQRGDSLRQRSGDQPLPAEGQENVQDKLIDLIKERRDLGVQRYGRPLQTFNGRNAVRDALEEALDLSTYLMQVEMEKKATQACIREALHLHRANEIGVCVTCRCYSPCFTRRILTSVTPPATEPDITVTTVHPVEEIAVHPDSVDILKSQLKLHGAEERLGAPIGQMFGYPIVHDDRLAPGAVRMRPRGYDDHPSARP